VVMLPLEASFSPLTIWVRRFTASRYTTRPPAVMTIAGSSAIVPGVATVTTVGHSHPGVTAQSATAVTNDESHYVADTSEGRVLWFLLSQ
jgi:hypothetical protein